MVIKSKRGGKHGGDKGMYLKVLKWGYEHGGNHMSKTYHKGKHTGRLMAAWGCATEG
jgi:hypothetical protein